MGFARRVKRRHPAALLLLTAATWAIAAPGAGDSTAPSGSARACGLGEPLPAAWSAPERWAWGQICQGRAADFDAALGTWKGSGRQTRGGTTRETTPAANSRRRFSAPY